MMASKSVDNKLDRSDVEIGCNICLEILTEPITMPCKHRMCKNCFEKNFELTALQCPFCKLRISNWCRKAKKVENLIDKKLWLQIQEQFPELVAARMAGINDEGYSSGLFEISWSHRFCSNGEIGEEFQAQLDEERREKEERDRIEEEKSRKYINEMLKSERTDQHTPSSSQDSAGGDIESMKLIEQLLKEESPAGTTKGSATPKRKKPNAKTPPPPIRKNADMRNFLKPLATVTSASDKENANPPANKALTPSANNSAVRGFSASQKVLTKEPVTSLAAGFSGDDIEIGIEMTPEFLESQMRLEAWFAQEKADKELAMKLQEEEQKDFLSPSAKRLKISPRQATLEETLSDSKKRKFD